MVSSQTLDAQAATCITSSERIIATGAPGMVAGATNESASTTVATMRNSLTGRRESRPMIAKTMAAPIVPTSELTATGATVRGGLAAR